MNSKQQTPLGYLMSLLQVSLSDLGDYLYVAKTSISKWKTGARALRPTSSHFSGIVEYFTMLTRDVLRREKMAQLFSRIFPDQPLQTEVDFARCVRAFLSGKVMPQAPALRQTLGEEGRLYTAQMEVFTGDAGTSAALEQWTGFLGAAPQAQVSVLHRGALSRLQALGPLLRAGRRMRLLLDMPPASALLGPSATLLFGPAAQVRIPGDTMPVPPGASLLVAGRGMLVTLYAPASRAPYASLVTDSLSVEQAQTLLDATWHASPPMFEALPRTKLLPDTFRDALSTALPERLDWLLPGLPYLTMSEELLLEVMRGAGVSGRAWTQVLTGLAVLKDVPMRLYIPAAALRGPQEGQPLLSVLCGVPITLSRAQAVRHMLDTAAALRAATRLQIIPVQQAVAALEDRLSPFVLRNVFCGALSQDDGTARISRLPPIVEGTMQALDGLAAQTTKQARSAGYVAGLLEQAALAR